MSDQSPHENGHDPLYVRKQFDEILAKEISSLIDIDSDAALGVYNLTTLACIVIAVEREREIKNFSDSPPERYTRESFMVELSEIGLSGDEVLESTFTKIFDMGLLSIIEDGQIHAAASAYTIVGFLDTMFPGMQGMNLIAFIMQMNEEVVSGRKSLSMAKQSFVQTLKSRGVAVTRERAEAKAAELANERYDSDASGQSLAVRAVSRKLKENAAKQIARLRGERSSFTPSLYSSNSSMPDRSTVKDIFSKGPSKEELEAEQAAEEEKRREDEVKLKNLVEREARLQDIEDRTKELDLREQRFRLAQEAQDKAEQKARELVESQAVSMEAKKAELEAMAEKIKAEEQILLEKKISEQAAIEESEADLEPEEPEPLPEEDIASRIAAFEAELAMPCPLCQAGKIVSETTAKDKSYYTCSNKECRFVSWDKPYHFQCPLCKNPFLTEITTSTGEKGLKCPRAACSYTQNNLLEPSQNKAGEPSKKKKVVRRVKRR